jgi:plastocyanin
MILTEQPNRTPPNSQPARSHRAHAISLVLLGALAVVLLLIALDVALIATAQAPAPARAKVVIVPARFSAPVLPTVDLAVAPSIKPGPDGQLHDAFSVTDFHVHVGQPVKLAINNTDNMNHSITSPDAGVSIIVKPGEHTYTLLVTKAGRFSWFCIYPCDPWSMQHDGYMRGYITAA